MRAACGTLVLSRRACAALSLATLLLSLAAPAAFSAACARRGDALWARLSPPGQYLAVQVLEARNLTSRSGSAARTPADAANTAAAAAASLRRAYVFVRTRPLSASGEQYRSATSAPSLAPAWSGDAGGTAPVFDVTFDTDASSRVLSVEVQLWDLVTPAAGQWLGSAAAALPAPGARVTPYAARAALAPSPGVAEAWYDVAGVADLADGAAPAAQVYVRVSYAVRHARSGYCEAPRPGALIAQPANSWSNVPFLASGAHMLAVALADARSSGDEALLCRGGMARFPMFSALNGLAQMFAGASSFLFHASMAARTQRWDVTGVYCLVAVPSLYLLWRLGALGQPRCARAAAAFAAAAVAAAAAAQLHAWRLERPARGCTPVVLAELSAMAALLALWLWPLGSPLAPDDDDAGEALYGGGACARWRRRRRRALPSGMAYTLCAAAAACILAAYGACASAFHYNGRLRF